MTKSNSPNFEVPPEMREFAEKSVQQARQAFESFVTAAQNAATGAAERAAGAQSGAREVGELAMQFAERNMASSFEFAQKLIRAKDVSEVVALHADYAKAQMSTLGEQAKELGQRAAKMAENGVRH